MRAAKTLVVITYLPAGAQGRELEMAIEGWARYYANPFKIVVVGEGLQVLDGLKERYYFETIESPRVPDSPGNYRPHIDYISCLRKVRAANPDTEGFVLVADDCYAVSPFGIEDILVPKVNSMARFAASNATSANPWRRDKARTRATLEKCGIENVLNFTTHIPIYYDWRLIEDIWLQYDMERVSGVIEDMYYNTLYRDRHVVDLSLPNHYRYPVWNQWIDDGALQKALDGDVIWVCNAQNGYCEKFEKMMLKKYGFEENTDR